MDLSVEEVLELGVLVSPDPLVGEVAAGSLSFFAEREPFELERLSVR